MNGLLAVFGLKVKAKKETWQAGRQAELEGEFVSVLVSWARTKTKTKTPALTPTSTKALVLDKLDSKQETGAR